MKAKFTIKKLIILIIALILLPSCNEDTKSKAKNVNKLEVLAIKVNKPQAHAGEAIVAEALVGHPEGYTNEFHTIWLLCIPKTGMGMQSCLSEGGIIGLPAIDADKFNFTIPTDILISEDLDYKNVYLLFATCESDMDTCQSVMTDKDGEGLNSKMFRIAYKTVEVIKDDSPIVNHNPTIKSIYLNSTELNSDDITLKADSDYDENIFKAEATSDSFDETKTAKGELDHENVVFAWKSTLGDIRYYYTDQKHDETVDDLDENEFEAAKSDENDTYKIYIIALDTNGGIDWKILNVTNEK